MCNGLVSNVVSKCARPGNSAVVYVQVQVLAKLRKVKR